jgi:hypothetical protein
MGEERKVYRVLVGSLKERCHSEDQGIDGRMGSMALREIGGGGVGVYIGSSWLNIGAGGGSLVNTVMNLRVLASLS